MLCGPMMYRHIFGPAVSRQWLAEGAGIGLEGARPDGPRCGGGPEQTSNRTRKKTDLKGFARGEHGYGLGVTEAGLRVRCPRNR